MLEGEKKFTVGTMEQCVILGGLSLNIWMMSIYSYYCKCMQLHLAV